jgi:c-di-GMP-binding flagellar brake protein YcgR
MPPPSENAHTTSHELRSLSRIAPLLEALAARRQLVTAELPGGEFTAHLVHADPGAQFIVVAATADEPANAPLLACARVTLVSRPDDWQIEFVGADPSEIMHEGVPAIRLRYPEVLTVQQRRQNERRDVPRTLSLRCVADAAGIAPFEARIRDISLDGLSVLLHPPDVILEPGTILVGSRIEIPGVDAVTVDLEVRYSEVVTLEDGTRARCSGFRFVNAPDSLKKKLIDALEPD